MANNNTLTKAEFARRYSFISEKAEAELEQRYEQEGRYHTPFELETTCGTRGENWMYFNSLLHSEAKELLDTLAYENSEGELVVDYADMREHLTSVSGSTSAALDTLPHAYIGQPIKVWVRLSFKDGEKYLNVVKYTLKMGDFQKLETVSLDTREDAPVGN